MRDGRLEDRCLEVHGRTALRPVSAFGQAARADHRAVERRADRRPARRRRDRSPCVVREYGEEEIAGVHLRGHRDEVAVLVHGERGRGQRLDHREDARSGPGLTAAVEARAAGLLERADVSVPRVADPKDGHAVAQVVALDVLRARARVRVVGVVGGLDPGLGVLEEIVASRDAHEEVRAARRDAAALAVATLRVHVVRWHADVDVRRRGDELSRAGEIGRGAVVVDARRRVRAVPDRVVAAVVGDLHFRRVLARLEAGPVLHRIDAEDARRHTGLVEEVDREPVVPDGPELVPASVVREGHEARGTGDRDRQVTGRIRRPARRRHVDAMEHRGAVGHVVEVMAVERDARRDLRRPGIGHDHVGDEVARRGSSRSPRDENLQKQDEDERSAAQ